MYELQHKRLTVGKLILAVFNVDLRTGLGKFEDINMILHIRP